MDSLHSEIFRLPEWTQLVRVSARLLIAAFLGGCIGFERQRERKAAGLRTHILVAMGATLFAINAHFHFAIRCVLRNTVKARVRLTFAKPAAKAGKELSRSEPAAPTCTSARRTGSRSSARTKGICNRRIYRTCGTARGPGRAFGEFLCRPQTSIRRQSRNWFRYANTARSREETFDD